MSIKKHRVRVKMMLKQYDIMGTNMLCYLRNVWSIPWIEPKIKIIELEPMK